MLTREVAEEIKQDLYESTLEGFADELEKSSPAVKKLARKFSGLINEFFEGYKDGIAQEMELQLSRQNLGVPESLKEGESLSDINATLKEISDKLDPTANQASADRLAPAEMAAAKDRSRDIIERSQTAITSKQGFATRAKEFALMSVYGAVGADEKASEKIQENRRREAFIKSETVLRTKTDYKFAKMSSSEQRKVLKGDYKTISKSTEKLVEVEKEASQLRSMGYTEEQIDKTLGYAEKRGGLVGKIDKSDSSRISVAANAAPLAQSEEQSTEDAIVVEKQLDESESQTILLSEIRDLLRKTGAGSTAHTATEADPSMPDIDLPSGKTATRGKGGLMRGVKTFGKNAFKFVKGTALPAAAMLGVGMGVDWLSGKAGVGQGLDVDVAQDDANWEKMSLAEKAESGAARGVEKVASFIGLSNFSKEAQSKRVANESAYFAKKSATMVDTKTGESSPVSLEITKQKALSVLGDPLASGDAKSLAKETLTSMGEPLSVASGDVVKKNQATVNLASPTASDSPGAMANEISKRIVINAPPPTVINSGGGNQQVMQMPFTHSIRHKEATMNDFLRSRYMPA
ncbi:MAG: hypothetical protein ACYDG4_16135 [Desulfuromonadaceae bacterium]